MHTTPLVFIHSTDDPFIPVSHAQRLAALAQAHQLPLRDLLYGTRHPLWAYGSNPGRWVTLLQQFLTLHVEDGASSSSNNAQNRPSQRQRGQDLRYRLKLLPGVYYRSTCFNKKELR